MEILGKVVLSVTAASLLCGILRQIIKDKGGIGATIHLISSLFILFTALSPWIGVHLGTLDDFVIDVRQQSDLAVNQGSADAYRVLTDRIREKTQVYIQDKAHTLGADLVVEVMLDEETLPKPSGVTLRGNVSPYVKSQLQQMLRTDLGIALEDQRWIS